MNKEVRYDDVKQKNGQVTIRLMFSAENNYDGLKFPKQTHLLRYAAYQVSPSW